MCVRARSLDSSARLGSAAYVRPPSRVTPCRAARDHDQLFPCPSVVPQTGRRADGGPPTETDDGLG